MKNRLLSDVVPDPNPKLQKGARSMLIGLMAVTIGVLGWRGGEKESDNDLTLSSFSLTAGIMGMFVAMAGFVSLAKGILKGRERSAYIKAHTEEAYDQDLFDQRQTNAMFDHIVSCVEKSLMEQGHFPDHDLIFGDKRTENTVREIITQRGIPLLGMYSDINAKNVLIKALTDKILLEENHSSSSASELLPLNAQRHVHNAQRQGTVTQQYRAL